MPDRRPLRVELVAHPGREEALKGAISLLLAGLVIGLQWWSVTPEPERMARLQKLGLTKCREKRWHFHGVPVQWPPGHCVCFWTETSDPEAQALADRAEGAWGGKE